MVREAANRAPAPAEAAPTAASSAGIRRADAASARCVIRAAGSLRVCPSHSKAENKNCYRN
jgi:hypothetical protein